MTEPAATDSDVPTKQADSEAEPEAAQWKEEAPPEETAIEIEVDYFASGLHPTQEKGTHTRTERFAAKAFKGNVFRLDVPRNTFADFTVDDISRWRHIE